VWYTEGLTMTAAMSWLPRCVMEVGS
jgi:hypothetical protein